jgi:hypothetical protein
MIRNHIVFSYFLRTSYLTLPESMQAVEGLKKRGKAEP